MARYLTGKSMFTSKDKTQVYYKLTILESLTERQLQQGARGYNASDYFVSGELYNQLPGDLTGLPRINVDFDVVAGKAYIAHIQVLENALGVPADDPGKSKK